MPPNDQMTYRAHPHLLNNEKIEAEQAYHRQTDSIFESFEQNKDVRYPEANPSFLFLCFGMTPALERDFHKDAPIV
jgi:hypothetical protein